MRVVRSRWRQIVSVHCLLIASATFTGIGILLLTLRSLEVDDNPTASLTHQQLPVSISTTQHHQISTTDTTNHNVFDDNDDRNRTNKGCATVEEMGDVFRGGFLEESLRIRKLIQQHFEIHGASRVRDLPPEQFCRQGFVIAKASEAGFGNEMYKILTAAALSIMLNRSLIIGQTRGKYPFGDYISYTDMSFTLNEVKHLWRQNLCLTTYGRHLVMRIDDFQKPARTNVLCSNWREWEEPIIWFQNTTDAVAAQFFLKNVHTEMRKAASELFGQPETHYRPNVFGELMRVLVSPSEIVKKAVNSVLSRGMDPDITLHMRMLMNKSVRALQAALNCTRKVVQDLSPDSRPKLVLVSDTPSFVEDVKYYIDDFAEVLHFDFESFEGGLSGGLNGSQNMNFRTRDWGPAPRWVAFVDFFLASRAKHAVISGAHRRVGTTYAQLIAALAAANSIGTSSSSSSDSAGFLFFSSFQSSLVSEGLKNQVGWGHVWNRFAGPLSCQNQSNQCANTPLLPPAWWDGLWQSPIPRDVRRMEAYGIRISALGTFDENDLLSFCNSRKKAADATITLV